MYAWPCFLSAEKVSSKTFGGSLSSLSVFRIGFWCFCHCLSNSGLCRSICLLSTQSPLCVAPLLSLWILMQVRVFVCYRCCKLWLSISVCFMCLPVFHRCVCVCVPLCVTYLHLFYDSTCVCSYQSLCTCWLVCICSGVVFMLSCADDLSLSSFCLLDVDFYMFAIVVVCLFPSHLFSVSIHSSVSRL